MFALQHDRCCDAWILWGRMGFDFLGILLLPGDRWVDYWGEVVSLNDASVNMEQAAKNLPKEVAGTRSP